MKSFSPFGLFLGVITASFGQDGTSRIELEKASADFVRAIETGDAQALGHSFLLDQQPTKAPAPTTFTVTARAIALTYETNQQNPNRNLARAAPANVAARL